jgi:DNA polymerase-3 subunit beta
MLSQVDDDEYVRIAMIGCDVFFQFGDIAFSTRLMTGLFPNYLKVIPNDCSVSSKVAAGSLLSAVRQAEAMTSEESDSALFSFSEERLELSSSAAEVGESKVVVNLKSHEGGPISVRLRPKFVSDFLKTVHADETVLIRMKDAKTVVIFMVGDKTKYVVMPMV